jgi:tRNA uridine 5-carboxymethylaminomethyl modification enzyme
VEIDLKTEGYARRQADQNRMLVRRGDQPLPMDFNFLEVPGLSKEALHRLTQVRPTSLGQAARISGVTPADLSILHIWLIRNNLRRDQPVHSTP